MTPPTRDETRLIGREAELERVRRAIEGDRSLLVTGASGIGKTTLIRAAIASTDRRRFEGGGFATLAWRPRLALARAIGTELAGDVDWAADVIERVVGPDVLFIDDLQWVDASTISILERLAGRIAIVMATRTEVAAPHLEAPGTDAAERLDLGPLEPDQAVALARRTSPSLSEARARSIAARAAGNPFLTEQLATSGETASLRRAVAYRLRALDPDESEALCLLALAERPIAAQLLGRAGHRLVEHGLAQETADGLTSEHALIADAIAGDLDAAERRRLHAALAVTIDDAGERARHLLAAGDRPGAHEAALQAVAGATTAGERAAHLGLAAAAADGPESDALRIEAAAALRTAGDLAGAGALLDAVAGDDPEIRARADAILARVCWSSGDPDGMRRAVDHGLALVDAHGSIAEAMLRAEAVVLTALVDGRFEDGLAEADAAILLAERAGSDPIRPLLLRATILTALGREGWVPALEAVVTAARAAGDAETELSALNNLVTGHEMHGHPADGRALAAAMGERARELRLAGWERQAQALLVDLDLHAGALDEAVDRAMRLLDEPLDPLAVQQVALAAALGLVDQARFEEARPLLDRCEAEAADDVSGIGDVRYVQAEAALWGGRPDEALRLVAEYRRYEASEYPTSHLVDVTAGWAAVEDGAPPPQRLARTEPSGMLVGASLERDAIDRQSLGVDEEVASAFDAAAAAYVGFHRRGELRARWAAAEARRRAGDDDRARRDLETLESIAAAQGFRSLLGRIHRSLRLVGVRRATPAETGGVDGSEGRRSGSPRLTPREREICRLVAGGATNVEIARRLGLGRPTVARLLSSAMDKLGVDSRAQVAAQVAAQAADG